MAKCKYCRRQYNVEPWYRREFENAYSVCPDCNDKLAMMKDGYDKAKEIGKKVMKGVSDFFEERKRNKAAPSARIRIRTTNADGFDDITSLSETQWLRLSSRQVNSIMNRFQEAEMEIPGEVALCIMKGIAWKYKDAKSYRNVAKALETGPRGLEVNIEEATIWYKKAAEAGDSYSDLWLRNNCPGYKPRSTKKSAYSVLTSRYGK